MNPRSWTTQQLYERLIATIALVLAVIWRSYSCCVVHEQIGRAHV